jgi:hypothetical protein
VKDWRLFAGLFALCAGFAVREHYHFLAAQDWAIEVAQAMGNDDPTTAPACVYDCSPSPSVEIVAIGWVAILLSAVGIGLVVWSRIRPTNR